MSVLSNEVSVAERNQHRSSTMIVYKLVVWSVVFLLHVFPAYLFFLMIGKIQKPLFLVTLCILVTHKHSLDKQFV